MTDITRFTNPRYIESSNSRYIHIGSLQTPTLSRIIQDKTSFNLLIGDIPSSPVSGQTITYTIRYSIDRIKWNNLISINHNNGSQSEIYSIDLNSGIFQNINKGIYYLKVYGTCTDTNAASEKKYIKAIDPEIGDGNNYYTITVTPFTGSVFVEGVNYFTLEGNNYIITDDIVPYIGTTYYTIDRSADPADIIVPGTDYYIEQNYFTYISADSNIISFIIDKYNAPSLLDVSGTSEYYVNDTITSQTHPIGNFNFIYNYNNVNYTRTWKLPDIPTLSNKFVLDESITNDNIGLYSIKGIYSSNQWCIMCIRDGDNYIAKSIEPTTNDTYYYVNSTAYNNLTSFDPLVDYYEFSSSIATYSLTTDTTPVTGKTYYTLVINQYSSENFEHLVNYYEYNNDTLTLTSDTIPSILKTYYILDRTATFTSSESFDRTLTYFEIDGSSYYKTTDSIPDITKTYYVFKVFTGNKLYKYIRTSDDSSYLYYNIYSISTPSNVEYNSDNYQLSWDASTTTGSPTIYYDTYVDDVKIFHEQTRSSILSDYNTGFHITYVIATVKNAQGEYSVSNPNPKYIDSDKTPSIEFGTLGNLSLSILNNVVTINGLEPNSYAVIYNYDDKSVVTSYDYPTTTFTIEASEPSSFNLCAKAYSYSEYVTQSPNYSNNVQFSLNKLASPNIYLNAYNKEVHDGEIVEYIKLAWQSISGVGDGGYYRIFRNNNLINTNYTVDANTVITDWIELKSGNNTFFVQAVNNNYTTLIENASYIGYLPSDYSDIYNQTGSITSKCYIDIEDEKIDLNLPISFIYTLDESMDSGVISTVPIDKKDPFEAYTDITVHLGEYEDYYTTFDLVNYTDVNLNSNFLYATNYSIFYGTEFIDGVTYYEYNGTAFVETEDETPSAEKLYFVNTIDEYTGLTEFGPYTYYEYNNGTFSITNDLNPVISKTYYILSFNVYHNSTVLSYLTYYKYSDLEQSIVEQSGFPIHMIISNDDVEEIVVPNNTSESKIGSKYIHHINLIERTKLLETVFVPDFSITQPMEYTQLDPVLTNEIQSTINKNYKLDEQSSLLIGLYEKEEEISREEYGYGYKRIITKITNKKHTLDIIPTALTGTIYTNYFKGKRIILPTINIDNKFIINKVDKVTTKSTVYDVNGNIYGTPQVSTETTTYNTPVVSLLSRNSGGIKVSYYYDYGDNNKISIGYIRYNNQGNKFFRYINGIPTSDGYIPYINTDELDTDRTFNFTVEIELESSAWNKILQNSRRNGADTVDVNKTLQFGYTSYINLETINNINDANSFINGTAKLQYIYSGSRIADVNIQDTDSYIQWESTSIGEALEKVINISKTSIDQDSIYSIENNLLEKYKEKRLDESGHEISVYPMPEMKFQMLKSLYEVLTDIGRLIHGIPRLGCISNGVWDNNCITFDIVDIKKLEEAKNANTLVDKESTIENHSTGYVSNLSNIISDEIYQVYPVGNLWTTARAEDYSDPFVVKDNMAIVVDKPIYKIKDLLIKIPGYNNAISLQGYLFEETYYNSLNNDANGKGMAIYYKKGDNRILGIDSLPEQTKQQATWGLNPDEYIINRILQYKIGIDVTGLDPLEYKYKVIYSPYNDTTIYTEQAYRSNLKIDTYKTLNQENNIITDRSFGKSAQTQIDRLGNDGISKSFFTPGLGIYGLPTIGCIQKYNNYNYYADEITYILNNNYTTATVNFSKNFNKINDRVGINSDYRQYRIYNSDYVTRPMNINQYAYITKNTYTNYKLDLINDNLFTYLKNSYNNGYNISKPSLAPNALYVKILNENKNRLQYTPFELDVDYTEIYYSLNIDTANSYSSTYTYVLRETTYEKVSAAQPGINLYYKLTPIEITNYKFQLNTKYYTKNCNNYELALDTNAKKQIDAILLPLVYSRFNNSISLSGSMYDNFSAGTYRTVKTVDNELKPLQKDVRYVDNNGEASYIDLTIGDINDSSMLDQLKLPDEDIGNTLPRVNWLGTPNKDSLTTAIYPKKGKTSVIYLNKDNKEKLDFNYQLHFLTYDKDISIKEGITERMFLDGCNVNGVHYGSLLDEYNAPSYYLYKGDARLINRLTDTTNYMSTSIIPSVDIVKDESDNPINISINSSSTITADNDYDGYCLSWLGGKILYAVKKDIPKGSIFTPDNINIYLSSNKLSYINN